MKALLSALALSSAVLFGCSSAPPAAPATPHVVPASACGLGGQTIVAVDALRVDVNYGKHAFKRTRGAVVDVEAAPGLTAEHLWLTLERRVVADRARDAACPLDVEGVKVAVAARGTGFRVTLTAPDTPAGEELLRRALAVWATDVRADNAGVQLASAERETATDAVD